MWASYNGPVSSLIPEQTVWASFPFDPLRLSSGLEADIDSCFRAFTLQPQVAFQIHW